MLSLFLAAGRKFLRHRSYVLRGDALTGKKGFPAEKVASTRASLVEVDPSVAIAPARIAPWLDRVLADGFSQKRTDSNVCFDFTREYNKVYFQPKIAVLLSLMCCTCLVTIQPTA